MSLLNKVLINQALIICKTIIGKGSPNKQGKESSHGAPLGEEEIAATRKELAWPHAPFEIPDAVYQTWNAHEDSGRKNEAAWQSMFMQYEQEYPELAMEFMRRVSGQLYGDFSEMADGFIQSCVDKAESIATRKASQNAIAAFGEFMPELIGGSADLTGSNLTSWSGSRAISTDPDGTIFIMGFASLACWLLIMASHCMVALFHMAHIPDIYGIRQKCCPYGCLDEAAEYYGIYPRFNWPR